MLLGGDGFDQVSRALNYFLLGVLILPDVDSLVHGRSTQRLSCQDDHVTVEQIRHGIGVSVMHCLIRG